MDFLRSLILWKYMSVHFDQSTTKMLPVEKISNLRIKTNFIFKLVALLLRLRLCVSVNNPITTNTAYIVLGKKRTYVGADRRYIKALCATMPAYNIFNTYSDNLYKHAYLVRQSVGNGGDINIGLSSALRRSALLGYSMASMYLETADEDYKDIYCKLLNGVGSCILSTTKLDAILKHPNLSIARTLGPVTIADISAIIEILSVFGRISDKRVEILEDKLFHKVLKVITNTDYLLRDINSRLIHGDIRPNARYNLQLGLLYICIDYMRGTLKKEDLELLKLLLSTKLYSDRSFSTATIVTANLIEAFFNIITNPRYASINNLCSSADRQECIALSIAWLEAFSPRYDNHDTVNKDTSIERYNPEMESILAKLYAASQREAEASIARDNTHRVISLLSSNNIILKRNLVVKILLDKQYKLDKQRGRLPRVYNTLNESYWDGDTEPGAIRSIIGPAYEFITPYARLIKWSLAEEG